MGLTPFEIRLELLKLAKDMLEQDYHAKREVVYNNWQTTADHARQHGLQVPNQPDHPPFPSEADVIAKAAALNEFVSQLPAQVVQKKDKKA